MSFCGAEEESASPARRRALRKRPEPLSDGATTGWRRKEARRKENCVSNRGADFSACREAVRDAEGKNTDRKRAEPRKESGTTG